MISALGLAACGGLNEEAKTIADACVASAFEDKPTCNCIGKALAEDLSSDEVQMVANLMDNPSIDTALDAIGSGSDADLRRMNRLQNATERALDACS
jgi:hypothetical protein